MASKRIKTVHRQNFLINDVLQAIVSFLSQADIYIFGQTCKEWRLIQQNTRTFKNFIIRNPKMCHFCSYQTDLNKLSIYKTPNIQRRLTQFPENLYIGKGCSLEWEQGLNYPKVKRLFIDSAKISVHWDMFPNLEELYIHTDQLDGLGIDDLKYCLKLKKIIIRVVKGVVYIKDPSVFWLPELEVFAVTGTNATYFHPITTKSPKLKYFLYNSMPINRVEGCEYVQLDYDWNTIFGIPDFAECDNFPLHLFYDAYAWINTEF